MPYYKVTDMNMKSLGLRRAVPIQYTLGQWAFPREVPQSGQYTKGGLWVGKNRSFVSWLRKYVKDKYGWQVRVFSCEIGECLYETSNRVKTDRVKLLGEI